MLRKYLLSAEMPFYKANFHGHTTISDGCMTPEEFVNAYRAEGYSVVAITDHERYRFHRELNTDDFICIAGCEEEIWPEPVEDELIDREKKCYHLNVFDLNPYSRPEGYEPPHPPRQYYDINAINEWIKLHLENDLLVSYNHPAWSMQDFRDYSPLRGLWAMEIYNHGCETEGMYGTAPQVYDEMLRNGQRLYCTATDDNHNRWPFESPQSDSFGGFTMINMPSLSYGNTAKAMKEGAFYASSGPLIRELSIDGKNLCIRTSPVSKICVFTESRRCFIKFAKPGSYIDGVDFKITGEEVYLRVQIQDAAGKYAWSRAYFQDELE